MSENATEPTATSDQPDTGAKDWAAEAEKWKALARKHEADAKAGKAAAARLAEIEEANKSEAQKVADRLAQAERRASEAEAVALRYRIATEFHLSDEDAQVLRHLTSEDGLRETAQALANKAAERNKNSNHVPREGNTPAPPAADPVREFARGLFSSGNP